MCHRRTDGQTDRHRLACRPRRSGKSLSGNETAAVHWRCSLDAARSCAHNRTTTTTTITTNRQISLPPSVVTSEAILLVPHLLWSVMTAALFIRTTDTSTSTSTSTVCVSIDTAALYRHWLWLCDVHCCANWSHTKVETYLNMSKQN